MQSSKRDTDQQVFWHFISQLVPLKGETEIAVALKCNVVASDIPIFRELFNDNEVNFFEIDNMESLSEAIEKAMTVDKSETALEKYMQKYTLDIFAERYLEVYKR